MTKRQTWLAGGLIAAGLLAYANSFSGPFIFDDSHGITENLSVRHLSTALTPPPRGGTGGRPVVNFTFALNYMIGGLDVRGYHVVNLAIHLLAGLLLWGIVRRTLERLGQPAGAAWAVALLWLVHPLQTECVDFISQRTESLMGFFFLLTLYCAIRALDSPQTKLWQLGAVFACGLGMGCKEVMAVAPVLVALYDYVFVTGSWRVSFRQRRVLYTGLAATWLMLPLLVAGVSMHAKMGAGFNDISPWDYAKMQCLIIVHYLRLGFWPRPLCIDYDDWPRVGSVMSIIPQGVLIVGLVIASIWGACRRQWWGFLGMWFFLILAPTSSFLPLATEVAAERRMYLPLAALIVLVVLWLRNLRLVVVPVVAVAFGVLTFQRNTDYRTAEAIWLDTISKRPRNVRALENLASMSKPPEAIALLERALVIDPNFSEAHYNLGVLFAGQQRFDEAAVHLKRATELSPASPAAWFNLGLVLERTGRLPEAETALRTAVRLDPESANGHKQLGVHCARQGRFAEAVQEFETALRLLPSDEETRRYVLTARLQLQRGEPKR